MSPDNPLEPLAPPCPAAIEAALRAVSPDLPPLCISFSLVLYVPDTEETTAYAVMSAGGSCARIAGTDLHVNDWTVLLISADCPVGRAVCCPPARLGECVSVFLPGASSEKVMAQIVSWNGSPLLTDEQRHDGCQKQIARNAAASAQADEKRKQAARRGKEDGIVAELRARRAAKEAAWKTPRTV